MNPYMIEQLVKHAKHELMTTVRGSEIDMHCLTCGWLLFIVTFRKRKKR